jgi:hypothetical protein
VGTGLLHILPLKAPQRPHSTANTTPLSRAGSAELDGRLAAGGEAGIPPPSGQLTFTPPSAHLSSAFPAPPTPELLVESIQPRSQEGALCQVRGIQEQARQTKSCRRAAAPVRRGRKTHRQVSTQAHCTAEEAGLRGKALHGLRPGPPLTAV